jgi:transcriptional regulator with XRE-family HTH domain
MKCPRCGGTGNIEDASANVGDMIRLHREAMSWTQETLAEKVAKSRAQIANIEGGRSDLPMKTLKKFADAFGVSMKDLVP